MDCYFWSVLKTSLWWFAGSRPPALTPRAFNSVRAVAKHDMALAVKQSNTAAAQSVLVQGTVQELHKRLASQGHAREV